MVKRFFRAYGRLSDHVGDRVLNPIAEIGDVVMFLGQIVRTLTAIPRSLNLIFESMLDIGVRSIPIALVISVFAGATTAWQGNYQLAEYVSMRYLGTAVSKSIILELGPVLTGLIVAGRIGASIAASLGAMKVTEQIDALATMAINPVRYLAMPRVVASIIMVPMLTIYSCAFGILAGMLVSKYFLGITSGIFIFGLKHYFFVTDVVVSLVKSFIFGIGISVLGCYYGFNASGGAEGVGNAAIKAFVTSAVFILLSDFMVASIAF
jgi:phospholipid/cholesterol/gamma-HCH transport system permease protein